MTLKTRLLAFAAASLLTLALAIPLLQTGLAIFA
jgi:hypothetical protein